MSGRRNGAEDEPEDTEEGDLAAGCGAPDVNVSWPIEDAHDLIFEEVALDAETGLSLRIPKAVRRVLRSDGWGLRGMPTPTHHLTDSSRTGSHGMGPPKRKSLAALMRALIDLHVVDDPQPEVARKSPGPALSEVLMDLPRGWTDLSRADIQVPMPSPATESVTMLLAFAGIGGGGLGICQGLADQDLAVRCIGAIEYDDYCAAVIQLRFGSSVPAWTNARAAWTIDRVRDAVGPDGVGILHLSMPCPPTSSTRQTWCRPEDHPQYFDPRPLIRAANAKWIISEHVGGFATREGGRYQAEFLGLLADLGYESWVRRVTAREFGLLHLRRRVIIIARRADQANVVRKPSSVAGAIPMVGEDARTRKALPLALFAPATTARERERSGACGDAICPVVARAAARCVAAAMLGRTQMPRGFGPASRASDGVDGASALDPQPRAPRPCSRRSRPAVRAERPGPKK